jgi:hypothetical protein
MPVLGALLRLAVCTITVALVFHEATDARAEAPTSKRALPDYGGRGGEPTTAGDVAVWVPRILVSPIYLVTEFVLRRPLGALISAAERAELPRIVYDFFFFGPDHQAGVAPIAFAEFGFNPSVGIYAFWNHAIFHGNDLRLHGAVWSSEWLAGSFTERIHLDEDQALAFRVAGAHRPDHAFFGIGPRSLASNISRFGEDLIEAGAVIDSRLWRSSRVEMGTGVRSVTLYSGHYGSDPSLALAAGRGAFPIPYGFEHGYTAQYNHLAGALDTRLAHPAPGSGVRLELRADQGNDVRRSPASGWIRYGATAGGFYDVNNHGRIVSVSVAASFADPLGNSPIPFPELVALGGDGPMRGFFPGRLLGRSALVATARYTWPIWVWLDGSLEASTGNVFGDHLEDFKPSLLRFSGAIGIESVQSPDHAIELLVGLGTETFEHGGQADSVRLMVGTNHGF